MGLAARAGGPATLICQAVADLYRQYENSIPANDPVRNERGSGEVVGDQCEERIHEVARKLEESWPMVARQSRQAAEAPVMDLQIMRRAFAQVSMHIYRACCLSVHLTRVVDPDDPDPH